MLESCIYEWNADIGGESVFYNFIIIYSLYILCVCIIFNLFMVRYWNLLFGMWVGFMSGWVLCEGVL